MRLLLRLATSNKRHLFLLGCSFLTMLFLTVAQQAEMLTIGILSNLAPGMDQAAQAAPTQLPEALDSWFSFGKDTAQNYLHAISNYLSLTTDMYHLALFLLGVALFKATALFSNQYMVEIVALRISETLRKKYFEHIQKLSMSFYHRYDTGSLSARVVADATAIAQALNAFLLNYLQMPFMVLTTLAICFMISWQLSLIIFIGLPLIAGPIVFLARRIKRIARLIQRNQERFTSVLIDFLNGIQTVKAFVMEAYSFEKYSEENREMARLEKRSARYSALGRPILHTIGALFLASVIIVGFKFIGLTLPELLTYCGLLNLFYEPIKKFAEQNNQIQRGVAAAERMFDVLHQQPEIIDTNDAKNFSHLHTAILAKNLWFRYENTDKDSWVLRDLSFEIPKGAVAAFVGPTGAGKSTILQLLLRLYSPSKGELFFDQHALSDYTQKSIREHIAYIPQSPFLFIDTIHNNITYGRNYSDEEVVAAAEKAHAAKFINELSQGYDTLLSERGKNLSGGQQQRLAIARALIKKAPILIMDEATSALDANSEHHIKQALQDLRGEVTQIIVAHRLSTIEDADIIFYLEEGRIVASGDRKTLIETCPQFRSMWDKMHTSDL